MIAWLIRLGAKWRLPEYDPTGDSLRRELYHQDPELVVELIRLLHAGSACETEFLGNFVNKPKMRGWLKLESPGLYNTLLDRKSLERR